MKIYKVENITDEVVEAFNRLIPQLSSSLESPTKEDLESMLQVQGHILFLAEIDGKIIGTVTLIICVQPSGKKGHIEDVIVDASARGHGVALQMMQAAIDYARKGGVAKLDLTSNPQREAAHRLYEKCGFEKRDTSVFRLNLS